MSQDFIVGPLAIARENNEMFADALMQQHILREVADAIKAYQADPTLRALIDDASREQLDLLWTSIADEWRLKGFYA